MKLPRSGSMNQHSEFALVKNKGRSKSGRFLVLATVEASALPEPKFAFITSKRVSKKAVTRNLVRRRLRHILSKHGTEISWPRYLVTIARYNSSHASPEDLEKDWLSIARKLSIISPAEPPTS